MDLYKDDRLRDKDFYFVHAVNRAPMLLNKKLFIEHLGHIDFSLAPFQCDDCELCLRAWLCGLKVGWYNAGFKSMIAGGMRIWNKGLMGVIYRRSQDPRNADGTHYMYAPDIVRGPDGRYYLYYTLDMIGIMAVAAGDSPTGPFEYYGEVRHASGAYM